jgi:hypothetical protein
MGKKVKPLEYPKRVQFARTVNFGELKTRASLLLSEKRADKFAFDLMELDEACESFRRDLRRVFQALKTAKSDSTDLYDSTSSLEGDFLEFKCHIRSALPMLNRLQDEARALPPISRANDLELTERELAPFEVYFKAAGIKKATHSKKHTQTRKVRKRKRKSAGARRKK